METLETKNSRKLAIKFNCKTCRYTCSKESDLIKHFNTRKHEMATNGNIVSKVANQQSITRRETRQKSLTQLSCICGKHYKDRSGLWKHKKKCYIIQGENNKIISSNNENEIDIIDKELIAKLLLSNQEIMKTVFENMPKMGVNQANNTNSFNTQNFNIQMFLNEHCKNAMNLTDFIDTLPITNETYDDTIENGLTKSITNMVVNGLTNLDVTDRPIHCTDSSRKVLYVKEADKWEKDNELRLTLQGIKIIALKQRTMINKWQDANKGWQDKDDLQTKLTNLVFNSMTDIENDEKETNKIIRAISKSVYLDNDVKNNYICNVNQENLIERK